MEVGLTLLCFCFISFLSLTGKFFKNVVYWQTCIMLQNAKSGLSRKLGLDRSREFKQRRRRHQRERQKSNRPSCITLFCTFLCRHCTTTTWKCQNSRFVEDVKTRQRLSLYLFSGTSIQSFRIQLQNYSGTPLIRSPMGQKQNGRNSGVTVLTRMS